ncbi:IclR family transcriptional regulator [Gallaecimonas mangrovi]|uniref:IclR family transcriptional regulator n=1 Tax=Gallaecimonas mangrovi TaxID=2291597 RepID=UPI000E209BA0|nr:IclR family transcriptional regulator [Gallaecimonas mangrovi]
MVKKVENGSQVIERAAHILKALEQNPAGLSLSELAKLSALPKTTVHRLCGALEAQQFVHLSPKGYRLGMGLARLAAATHRDVVSVARPAVEALARRTRETVDLCVYRGLHAISVDQYQSDQELRVVSAVGTAFPSHCTAHGKAMLAALSEAALAPLLAGELVARTAHSIVEPQALRRELADIGKSGIAIDNQEHAEGVCGIGVRLAIDTPEPYALALAVPALRFAKNRLQLKTALLQCKAEIEARWQ